MTDNIRISTDFPTDQWPLKRIMLLGATCLVVGITAGWLIRGLESSAAPAQVAVMQKSNGNEASPVSSADIGRLKQQADSQAAPLVDQLKAQPDNADELTRVGNIYYDAQQYPTAIDYYQHALKTNPADASVRTDMGTAYWYMGNADAALLQFDQALTYAPTNANTLFNRGLVRWEGKGDAAGATSDWKKLLATNPNYEAKTKVEQMLAEVAKHSTGR
jgi:tetratricopeptide (TPR) repeat protein